jgi:eukaryotic-like serine/threonine-protein kinase
MRPKRSATAEAPLIGPTILMTGAGKPSSPLDDTFPADLFEQARGRLRLLTGFFIVAFGFDLSIFLGTLIYHAATHTAPEASVARLYPFQVMNFGATVASVALWWAAGSHRVSAPRLHAAGLVFEVVVCFISALLSHWQGFLDTGRVPTLTWVPAIIIMFPLIMPGPPSRMLVVALVSAAMSPLSLVLLTTTGHVSVPDLSPFAPATIGPLFGVAFAWLGARVVYGLGREVARARAMGSYRLEERIGVGGMGEVWRARHQLLARPAAIKLIRPTAEGARHGVVETEARERFEREAQVISRLRSPHTVELFDFGVAGDGSFYYAMELLEGLDVETLVRRFGPQPAERVVHIMRQACHSLSEAGTRGLVHRDIKPANLYLCRYGEEYDFVKVLDFGIVKVRQRVDSTEAALTGQTVVPGTPAYIAPEQVLGNVELDGRADIYALGCVAYWLLTGQNVFAAPTPTALMLKHVHEAPVPPSQRTELPLPPALDAIVMACLAKDPAGRPATARELASQLAALPLAQGWDESRRRQWWERHLPESADQASP